MRRWKRQGQEQLSDMTDIHFFSSSVCPTDDGCLFFDFALIGYHEGVK